MAGEWVSRREVRGGGPEGGERRRALTILSVARFPRKPRVTCAVSLPGSVLGSKAGW